MNISEVGHNFFETLFADFYSYLFAISLTINDVTSDND